MPLQQIEVHGYRSLREVRLPLGRLNVISGPNGSGKSNLYRSLWLISQICEGSFARSLAREGGLMSAMWAGPRLNAKKPVRMSLGFQTADFSFGLACGFPVQMPTDGDPPPPPPSRFAFDPEIKEEAVWAGRIRRPSTTFLERSAGMTTLRDIAGESVTYPLILDANESVLSQLREPHRFPELFLLREEVRGWRFYHGFRTDEAAPLRSAQASVRTPVLSHDGSDVAAALQTIIEVGDSRKLQESIDRALPGRRLRILANDELSIGKSPRFIELMVGLETEGCQRPLLAKELSDGTLKYLCLTAALLSPRPPALIALNEPEASLHPDLLEPLAGLIVDASLHSQIWVTTHSQALAQAIEKLSGVRPVQLALVNGETMIEAVG